MSRRRLRPGRRPALVRPFGGVLLLGVGLLALQAAGCGGIDRAEPAASPPPGWTALPAPPLSARIAGIALWTGEEVLVVGGSDAPPCPPTASCAVPSEPPMADGAAFDPKTETWRRIVDAPVAFDGAEGVVLGRTAYLWIRGGSGRPGTEPAFLAYGINEDNWQKLPLPDEAGDLSLAAAGDRLVAYSNTDEHGEQPDLLFDPATASWIELPPDPLSPSFDRVIAWSGRDLVLFDHALVPNPGSKTPALTRAAAFDLETCAWRRLPDSDILATAPWAATAEGRLVNPALGAADGGEVNNWGRSYPYGGVLDPQTGDWSALPAAPDPAEAYAVGVLTRESASYFGPGPGLVLDTTAWRWLPVEPLGDGSEDLVTGRTVVAAGQDLFVFGGARWHTADLLHAELLNDAYAWSPSR
jgi:hypothetical protein